MLTRRAYKKAATHAGELYYFLFENKIIEILKYILYRGKVKIYSFNISVYTE